MSGLLEPDTAPAEHDILMSKSSLTIDEGRAASICFDDVSQVTNADNGPISDRPSIIDDSVVHDHVPPNEALFRALVFLLQYEQSRDTVHLEAAIQEYRVLIRIAPVEHPDYLAFKSFLCIALCEQFDLWGDLAVIEEAVELGDAVMSASCPSHPDYLHHLCCSARSLAFRYEAATQESDVTRAVELVEMAKAGIEQDCADKACILMTHGMAHSLHFHACSDTQSLQRAIGSLMSALSILNEASSDQAACLISLSTCHFECYLRLNALSDLSIFVFYAQSAVDMTSSGDPRLARSLNVLAVAFLDNWVAHQNGKLLEKALLLSKLAVGVAVGRDRKLQACLGTYADGLARRYEVLGSLEDLNEAVRLYECALGSMEDLNESARIYGTALGMGRQRERNYRRSIGGYCYMLWLRSRATGSLQDLDNSIYQLQKVLAERSPAESWHQINRTNLGAFIAERYDILKRPDDLLRAVQIFTEIAAVQPTKALAQYNAGDTSYLLYEQTRESAYLDSAIRYFHSAEANAISHTYLASHYTVFGSALLSLAHLSARTSDWDIAVQRLRLAVHHAPPGHYRRLKALRILASGLRQRFEALSNSQDISESISLLTDVLAEAAGYERARFFSALGEAMASYFHSFHDSAYLDSALDNFQSAANNEDGFISERFHVAVNWGALARNNAYHSSAHKAYQLAVQLLPRIAWIGFRKHIRLEELQKQATTLAVDAAAAAIENCEYESAVELLESGRAVFWSQLLQLRTDFDSIEDVAPSVATELHDVSRALEMDVAGSGGLEGERLLQRQRRLAERWEQLLEEVRKIDGFQAFLTSPKFSDLLPSAEAGPVVIFNASESQCDAIIISPKVRAYHCPLPLMRMNYALLLSRFLRQALMVPKDRGGTTFLDGAVLNVLDRLWTTVGAPVWEALRKLYSDGMPRRVWFCPTGPFCLLPLHAAKPTDGPGFPDLFICSYTVTLSSLIRARADRQHAGQVVEAPNLLAVSQPATPGYDPLECAVEEMRVIYDSGLGERTTFLNGSDATVASVCEEMLENAWVHFSCHGSSNTINPLETCLRFHDGSMLVKSYRLQTCLQLANRPRQVEEMRVIYETGLGETTTFLNGADATVASVCEEMLENAWVHFSCHGSSNAVNPLETCFRFHDGPLNLSRISELRLPHADFAFLSACHTARAFGNLPDEALHLAAGLQLAGFKSVIGTQWSIADIDAPEVAKIVYEYMTQEGRYDHRSAAEGLHKAVNTLRSRGVASWRWVPFIHLGV